MFNKAIIQTFCLTNLNRKKNVLHYFPKCVRTQGYMNEGMCMDRHTERQRDKMQGNIDAKRLMSGRKCFTHLETKNDGHHL